MHGYTCHVGAADEEPIRPSLRPDTAPFRLLQRGDLAQVWQDLPDSCWLAIELPDTPWGRSYYRWAVEALGHEGRDPQPGGLGVLLASIYDFRNFVDFPGDAHREAGRCLQSLLVDGTPPRDHVVRVFRDSELTPGMLDTAKENEAARDQQRRGGVSASMRSSRSR